MIEQLTKDIGEVKATLFDIQRFSVKDGPGIRTNLFFKGCPLRCIWCHNPESYLCQKQLSFRPQACTGCMACVDVCDRGVNQVTQQNGHLQLSVQFDKCNACGKCLDVCCYDARSIIGRDYTVSDLKKFIAQDMEYYKIPDEEGECGGITLTGGEPMAQFSFIDFFLNEIKDIHICMETSGFAPTWQYERLLGRVHLFLFDYKVTDPLKHKRLCGVDNQQILTNLEFLCSHHADMILRLPLISGLNDDDEHFEAVAKLLSKYANIRRAEIMAYHNMGVNKADQIGLSDHKEIQRYNGNSASEEQKQEWVRRFKEKGAERIRIS